MTNDGTDSGKGQYAELIAMLREQQTKLEPFVGPNGEIFQALNRHMKDFPDDDENVQTIMQGLDHFRKMYNTVDNDIRILQQADKGGAVADGN